ncbi:winged helix-turn-helix domain-containing protein [Cereibacter sphaeroides]|uniref:winged helix-turn-helix domain-containing protein n=1 Tax=Cereibacter sphaeroides TaxID=1063 RepID=UPI001F33EEC1|nr:FCD domain-containing protein [Cereibacter sphaeroides]
MPGCCSSRRWRRRAAARRSAEDVALLRAAAGRGRAARDRAACERADDAFHRAIAEVARNPLLIALLRHFFGARCRAVLAAGMGPDLTAGWGSRNSPMPMSTSMPGWSRPSPRARAGRAHAQWPPSGHDLRRHGPAAGPGGGRGLTPARRRTAAPPRDRSTGAPARGALRSLCIQHIYRRAMPEGLRAGADGRAAGTGADGAERVALLAAIGRTGSIAGGAREVGLSYKAAWDAGAGDEQPLRPPRRHRGARRTDGGGASSRPEGEQVIAAFAAIETGSRAFCPPSRPAWPSIPPTFSGA